MLESRLKFDREIKKGYDGGNGAFPTAVTGSDCSRYDDDGKELKEQRRMLEEDEPRLAVKLVEEL